MCSMKLLECANMILNNMQGLSPHTVDKKERRSIKPSLSSSMSQCPRTTWRTQNGIILRQFKKGTIYKDMGGVFPKPTGFHGTTLPSPNMAETGEEQFLKPRRGVEGSVHGEKLRVVIKVP